MTQIFLDQSNVNNLIAALMLASVRYDTSELKKIYPDESRKYSELEARVRELCTKEGETLCAIIGSRIN